MSVLCDWELRLIGPDVLDPFDPSLVQPASIDIRLGRTFRVLRQPSERDENVPFSIAHKPDPDEYSDLIELDIGDEIEIEAGEAMLGSTLEVIAVPNDLVMTLEGKSSLARMFLLPHVQAGYFDPGWRGVGTLELVNLNSRPICLIVGEKICQSRWMRMSGMPHHPYGSAAAGSHYQGATTVEGAKG